MWELTVNHAYLFPFSITRLSPSAAAHQSSSWCFSKQRLNQDQEFRKYITTWNPQADTSQQGCGCQPTCTVKEVLSCTPRITICFLAKEKKNKMFSHSDIFHQILENNRFVLQVHAILKPFGKQQSNSSQYFWSFYMQYFSRFAAWQYKQPFRSGRSVLKLNTPLFCIL